MSVKSIVVKTLLGLLIVSLLVGCIFLLSKHEDVPISEETIIYSADEASVKRIEVKSADGYSLTKIADGWIMEGLEGISVNKAFVDALVKSLCSISSPMLLEENVSDFSVYGLDDNAIRINLTYADGDETVWVGKKSGEYRYLRTSKSENVYLVSENDLYMVFLEKIKYLDTIVFKTEADKITKIAFGDVVLEKKGDDWFEILPYERLADASAIEKSILLNVAEIQAIDIIKKADILSDELTSVIVCTGEDEVSFDVYQDGYLCCESSDYAYKVSDEKLSFLNITGFDIISKYVAPISITTVKHIEFISPKGITILSIDAPSTQAPIFYKDGKEATDESFRKFYQNLMALTFQAEGMSDGNSEYEIIFTKESGEKYHVAFIDAGESDFAISINGITQFTITKKSVMDVFSYLNDIETI